MPPARRRSRFVWLAATGLSLAAFVARAFVSPNTPVDAPTRVAFGRPLPGGGTSLSAVFDGT